MQESGLGTTLKKLFNSEGKWVLEVERLVPFGRHMHQPLAQKIEGAELIAKHMRAVPELSEMAEVTEKLMQTEAPADCYEIWQGSWVEQEMVHALSLQKAKKNHEGVVRSAPAGGAERKAVAKLEISQEKLAERLSRLERGDTGALAEQVEKMGGILSSLAARLAAIETKLGIEVGEIPDLPPPKTSDGRAGGEADAAASDEEARKEASGEEGDTEADASVDESEDKPDRPTNRMRPPSVVAMRQSLTMLVGEEVGMKERKSQLELNDSDFYQVSLNDDEGTLIGVMIADYEATIRLSCQLLMLPETELNSQLDSQNPTEDSIETMSEIFNTMSATINNVKQNPHVRTTSLSRLDPEEFAWLESTKRRLDVDIEGGGCIIIAAL